MKSLYKAALLAALGLVSVSAVQAQEMLLGFNDAKGPGAAQNDYVIDLGSVSLFTDTASFTLSSIIDPTTFNTAFGADTVPNDVAAGVVGGVTSGAKAIYQTAPIFSTVVAGNIGTAAGDAAASTIGEYASSSQTGWTYYVAASPVDAGTSPASSVANSSGNPMQYLSSGVVTESLYEGLLTGSGRTATVVDSLVGTLNIDANSGSVMFTGVNAAPVPEPATYGLMAGAGLLLVAFRRQFAGKNA